MASTDTRPRRALIVIDVQNEYFTPSGLAITHPPAAQSLGHITRAVHAAQAAAVPVVVVQHELPVGAPIFASGSEGWKLHPDIAAFTPDLLVQKTLPSVFARTPLADWLQERQIDTLSIVGFMTHNCNASTVFEGFHRGYTVEVLSDATGALAYSNDAGSASAEEIHRVFSVVFHSNFAAVATTDAWITAVQNSATLPRGNILESNRRAAA